MRTARFVAALFAVVVLHTLGTRLVPEFARSVDLFLVLTVLWALGGDSLSALLVGLTAGLTHDVLTSGLFALHGFVDTAAGYAVARLSQRLLVERASSVFLLAGGASLLQQVLMASLVLVLLPEPELPEPLWVAVQSAVNALLAGIVFLASGRLREGVAAHRQNRSRKLHLD